MDDGTLLLGVMIIVLGGLGILAVKAFRHERQRLADERLTRYQFPCPACKSLLGALPRESKFLGECPYCRAEMEVPAAPGGFPNSAAPSPLKLRRKPTRYDLPIAIAAWVVLCWMTINELNKVEFGHEKATVWAPIAGLYNLFGYWPAALLLPLGPFVLIGWVMITGVKRK